MSHPARFCGPLFTAIYELARAENVLENYSGIWQEVRSLVISTAISSELLLNTINDPGWNYDYTPSLRKVTNKLESSGVLTEKQAEGFRRLGDEYNRGKHEPLPPHEMEDIAGTIKSCLDSLKDLVRKNIVADFDVVFPSVRWSERYPRAERERKLRVVAIVEERQRLCKALKAALEEAQLWDEFAARRKKANEDDPFNGEWGRGLTRCEVCGEVSFDDFAVIGGGFPVGECCVCGFHLDLEEAEDLSGNQMQGWDPMLHSFEEWEQWRKEYPKRIAEESRFEELRRRMEKLKEMLRRAKDSKDHQGGEG